jgi:hypothetical protein
VEALVKMEHVQHALRDGVVAMVASAGGSGIMALSVGLRLC